MARDLFTGEEIIEEPSSNDNFDVFKRHGIDPYAKKDSITNAVFHSGGMIANDVLQSLGTAPSALLNTVRGLPGQITESAQQVFSNPGRSALNVGAGVAQGLKGLYNAPINATEYLASRDVPLFKQAAPGLSQIKIGDTGLQEALLGSPRQGDELLQGLGAFSVPGKAVGLGLKNALGRQVGAGALYGVSQEQDPIHASAIPLAARLAAKLPGGVMQGADIAKRLRPEAPAERVYKLITDEHDRMIGGARDKFQSVSNAVKNDFTNPYVHLHPEILRKAYEYGPSTKSFKDIVDKASMGDYDAVRKLESALGERSRKAGKGSVADQDLASNINELVGDIKNSIASHFEANYKPELNDTLNQARDEYRTAKQTFDINPTFKKLVGKNRQIPGSYSPLEENSVNVQHLIESIPALKKLLADRGRSQELKQSISNSYNATKPFLQGGATIGGAMEVAKLLGYL